MEESKNEKEDLIMNSSKVKEFVKSHKKELLAGAMLVGGTVLVIVGIRHSRKKVAILQKTFENDVPIPEGFKRWKPAKGLHRQGCGI